MPITEEVIEQIDKLSEDEVLLIMVYGYVFFEWYSGIDMNETMANYEE